MNTQSEQISDLITALSKAQGEIKPAIKSSINPHFKNKYANLSEVWEACRDPLSKYNLAITQTFHKDEHGLNLITTLGHASGQWMKSVYPISCKDPSNPQSWGSSITYARRYTLSSIVGIAPDEDDDGNKAAPRYITPDQIRQFNENYDKCDEVTQGRIDQYISSLDISDLSRLQEKEWKKCMVSFDNYFKSRKS